MSSAPATSSDRIGPYVLLDVLGEGGMGVVYRARHATSTEPVALKTIRLPREHLLANLRREIHALGRLRHPGVVRVLDTGVEHGLPWYAMELVEGPTLAAYLAALWSPPEEREAVPTRRSDLFPSSSRVSPPEAPATPAD